MSVREFWLTNSQGNKYNLNDKSHFLYLPNGLGFQKSYTSTRLGNNEKIDNEVFNMVDVGGEILFNSSSNEYRYQLYDDFIEFIKYKPLQLHYKTPNKIYGYYADIVITSLEKSEVSYEDTFLHCPIVFHRSTQWKNDNITKLVFANEIDTDGKYYDYTYDYHYASNSLSNMTPITNNGTEECSFIYEVVGEVENPSLQLLQNGVPYGIIKLDGTFTYIRIDSDELNESIYLEDENGTPIPMPYNYQVIESQNLLYTWVKLRVGENSGVFNASNIDTFDGVIKLTYAEKRATS